MDAEAIQAVLEEGKIGGMPFPEWVEQIGKSFALDSPQYRGRPPAECLASLGVVDVRWEPGENNPDKQRLWQAYLVVTLPEAATETQPSLKLIHDIAVEACGSYFYFLRGQELWIEYLVAHPEIRAEIELALEMGRTGELPFPMWLRYIAASTDVKVIACTLAARGVTAVRWEQDKYQIVPGVNSQSYLVLTLPGSPTIAPPSLPSERFVRAIVMLLRQSCGNSSTQVTDTGVELWVSFSMKLPLEEPLREEIERDGITFASFITSKAKIARARARRRALWHAFVNYVRRR
jgi:hypothetical protein